MITGQDIPSFKKLGFDAPKYMRLQIQAIDDKMSQFPDRLYLEVAGKFLSDIHAARVLPGFDPFVKKEIFSSFADVAEILFCVNAQDIVDNKQLSSHDKDYTTYTLDMITDIENQTHIKPHIVINMLDPYSTPDVVGDFQRTLQRQQFKVWERYSIEGYPEDVTYILDEDGFGQDDHIPLTKNLIFVTGSCSHSGKSSTCLGQIYQDSLIDIDAGYAIYETFPLSNLPLDHPVNLAYEAATADIGDMLCLDHYHLDAYDATSTSYTSAIEVFPLVSALADTLAQHHNFMHSYKSPTDMGINSAGSAITNDRVVCLASLQEIQRRKEWYHNQANVQKCAELAKKAKAYCEKMGYKVK